MTATGGDHTSEQVAALRAEMDAQKVNVARFWAQEWPALLKRLDEHQAQALQNAGVLARIDEKLTTLTTIRATLEKHDARLTALENVRWYAAGIAVVLSAAVTWLATKFHIDTKGG
jgi:anti-sigma-K factor RskA